MFKRIFCRVSSLLRDTARQRRRIRVTEGKTVGSISSHVCLVYEWYGLCSDRFGVSASLSCFRALRSGPSLASVTPHRLTFSLRIMKDTMWQWQRHSNAYNTDTHSGDGRTLQWIKNISQQLSVCVCVLPFHFLFSSRSFFHLSSM